MSLRAVIEGAGLTLSACASTLGVDKDLFQQWADSKREIPPAYATTLGAVLGVKPESFTSSARTLSHPKGKVEPSAIWFKFRGEEFRDADRESILLVRRLGHNANQLERATMGQPNEAWTLLFQSIRDKVDLQASPQEQGKVAAKAFCAVSQFGTGGTGSSEFLRGSLRSKGILLIESPIPQSSIEGCTFLVGESTSLRPCLFINTYKTTWFRRNVLIMHELGHALFDQTSGVEIDVVEDPLKPNKGKDSLSEIRAESFARECLLPTKLIHSFCSQNGVSLTKMTPESLAGLVVFSGVEKKTVLEILRDSELIDDVLFNQYQDFDISKELRAQSDHALNTFEYVQKIGLSAAASWLNKRFTTIGHRKLLLPVAYVKAVIEAVRTFQVNIGRAAELLMIDAETFSARFPELVAEVSE